ncbi:MAG: hypothetical protein OEZ13_11430 [Spirochaetia bacterium]|nr:hypothetical protein [Spirochaetia bacterium]
MYFIFLVYKCVASIATTRPDRSTVRVSPVNHLENTDILDSVHEIISRIN